MSGSENWNPLRSNYSSADLDLVHQARSANYSITIMFNVACENRRFAGRNVCDSVTEIPYRWRKICPESGHKRWAFSRTNTILYQNRRGARRNGCFRRLHRTGQLFCCDTKRYPIQCTHGLSSYLVRYRHLHKDHYLALLIYCKA